MLSLFSQIAGEVQEVMPLYLANSYVPYSGKSAAVLLLLSDGSWLAGVRVENASYPLTISPLVNAFSTAVALGRFDIALVVSSEPLRQDELQAVAEASSNRFEEVEMPSYFYYVSQKMELPTWQYALNPLQSVTEAQSGMILAQQAAKTALIPESDFPVGCALMTTDGNHYIAGCNVEFADWQRIICGERNALGTAITYGLHDFSKMYLTCPKDYTGTPCGACRQVLFEFLPQLELIMDRGENPPFVVTPQMLLPYSFTGETLRG